MRTAGLIALALVALVAPAWSEDVYRWRDGSGSLHYSSNPPDIQDATRLGEQLPYEATPPDDSPDSGASPSGDAVPYEEGSGGGDPGARAPDTGDASSVSTAASLRRSELERDLRATQKRMQEIDDELRTLAAQRTRNAAGSAATGGVGTQAVEVRSDEETSLADERDELSKHAGKVRSEAIKLREELTAQLGSVPDWWIDLR